MKQTDSLNKAINEPKGSSIVPGRGNNAITTYHKSNAMPQLLNELTLGFDRFDNAMPF